MATTITIYQTADGKKFDNQSDADAHESLMQHHDEIRSFVEARFETKAGAKRKSPHIATAIKAIALWIAAKK